MYFDDEDEDNFIWQCSTHERVLSLLPRKCRVSGESLWFKKAYRCTFYHWADKDNEWYSEKSYVWKTLKI